MAEIDEIKDLTRKLEPKLGAKAENLWNWWLTSRTPLETLENKQLLRSIAENELGVSYADPIRLPPPVEDLLKGDYSLGTVIYPDEPYAEIGLTDRDFPRHLLIVGATGVGKTNLMFNILRELANRNKPFLIFDWKQNYRHLKALSGFKDLRIFRLGDDDCAFKFNPLIPPSGTKARHWLTLIVDVMKHAYFFMHGAEFYFRKGIDDLYKRFGIYEGKTVFPTFHDVQKILLKEFVRGREMLWMSSVKRSLASLTFEGLMGDIVDTNENQELSDLLDQQVVIELDNLATIEKIFLTEALLLWIYHYRKAQGTRNNFKHVIVIEEAHHIASAKKEQISGEETIIESTIRQIREFGESIIAIDQEPSKLSDSLLANTNAKICFTLGNGKDIATMARAMSLRQDEQQYIDKLKIGHALVKLKDRFPDPVHLKFPLFDIERRTGG